MKSRFTINRILPLVCIAFLLSFSTFAQQNKKISLQGFLKDANGKAVENSNAYEITFKLYTTPTGGTAAWTETQTLSVLGGVYSTQLGKTVSLENLNWGASTYYVGVTIQGTELSPRTELTFAPYSLGSPKAQEVVCSGAVGDVKYSILNPQQFALQNGNCWVPMDGGSMAGSKLAGIIGGTNVPNAGGMFLRGQESQNGTTDNDPDRFYYSTIAQPQGDIFGGHSHGGSTLGVNVTGNTSDAGYANLGTFLTGGYSSSSQQLAGGGSNLPNSTSAIVPSHQHSINLNGTVSGNTTASGGLETRPKNLNLWTYIRIN